MRQLDVEMDGLGTFRDSEDNVYEEFAETKDIDSIFEAIDNCLKLYELELSIGNCGTDGLFYSVLPRI